MKNLAKVINKHEDVSLGAGLREEEVQLLQGLLSLTLPPDYVQYLQEFGWIEVGSWEFIGFGKGVPIHLDVVHVSNDERANAKCPLPHHLIPIAADGYGNYYCLSASSGGTFLAQVVFWNHETQSTTLISDEGLESWVIDQIKEDRDI